MAARIRRLGRVAQEIQTLGPRWARFRIGYELKRRSGWERLAKPVRPLDLAPYRKAIRGAPREAAAFADWWRQHARESAFPTATSARAALEAIPGRDSAALTARAERIAAGEFLCFRDRFVAFGRDPDWQLNPNRGVRWPETHSAALLVKSNIDRYGDFKLPWELGRFAFVPDLVRAWLGDGNDRHIDRLFELYELFADRNPMYSGLHWTSEQEVAIRAVMMLWSLDVLRTSPALTSDRLERTLATLYHHGRYLARDLDYARHAIRNNHLILGALGLYALGQAMPWVEPARRWRQAGRAVLIEAAGEQWSDDGGYVQPSHNYHRLAWHGMLIARKIGLARGDRGLVAAVEAPLAAARNLLMAMHDPATGRLPNWGPNDGALLGVWTDCAYPDFRPLLQTMARIDGGAPAFPPGPWDEECLWLLGPEEAAERPRKRPAPRSGTGTTPAADSTGWQSFPQAGLHVLGVGPGERGVFRCGSVRSRYGQQADQLHVDLWAEGANLALDAGSVNYNEDLTVHDWYRGTAAHNTVRIGGVEQMIPHRKFMFLRWTRAGLVPLPPAAAAAGPVLMGWHDGYTRLPGRWLHMRMVQRRGDGWLVVDRVWPQDPSALAGPTPVSLHWQFVDVPVREETGPDGPTAGDPAVDIELGAPGGPWSVHLRTSAPAWTAGLHRGERAPRDGWQSRHYNREEPVPAFRGTVDAAGEVWFVTSLGPSAPELILDSGERTPVVDGEPLPLAWFQVPVEAAAGGRAHG